MAENVNIGSTSAESNGVEKVTETYRRGRLYGRKWQVLIFKPAYTEKTDEKGNTTKEKDPKHDVEIDVSSLRCVFKTKAVLGTIAQTCTLVVYNMNAATEKEIIEEGFQIAIYGGYDEGQYGQIYIGDIVQIYRNRENGIDYRLEIIAIAGAKEYCSNFVKSALAAGSTPREQVNQIAKSADRKISVGEVSEELQEKPLPRGKVLFGTPAKYLRDICMWNDANFWSGSDGKLVLKTVEQVIPEDQVLVLTPTTGLVGTPAYSDDGIHIKMLLDPRVVLQSMIKIDNEIIQRQAIQINADGKQNSNAVNQNMIFDKDGEYQVFSVEHSGDTYGDEWTTSVIAAGRNGRLGKLAAVTDKQTMK